MSSCATDLVTLAGELIPVENLLVSLEGTDWAAPTLLAPPDRINQSGQCDSSPGTSVFSMTVLGDLTRAESSDPVDHSEVGFFRLPELQVDPIVHWLAWTVTDGRTSAEVLEYCRTAFHRFVREAIHAGSAIGGTRADQFVCAPGVEAVVHGVDLAAAVPLLDIFGAGRFVRGRGVQRFWRDFETAARHLALNFGLARDIYGRGLSGHPEQVTFPV
jgi:hypothetical protein